MLLNNWKIEIIPKFNHYREYRKIIFDKIQDFLKMIFQEKDNKVVGIEVNYEMAMLLNLAFSYIGDPNISYQQLISKIVSDATRIGNKQITVSGFITIFQYIKSNRQSPYLNFPTKLHLFGEKSSSEFVVPIMHKKPTFQVFKEKTTPKTTMCSDWLTFKSLFDLLGDCPWCGGGGKCKDDKFDDEHLDNCEKCQKCFSDIGLAIQYLFLDSKLSDVERFRLIIEILHATLRSCENHGHITVDYAIQLGNKIETIDEWIKKNIAQRLGVVFTDLNKPSSPSNLTFTGGNEVDKLDILYLNDKFVDKFIFEKDYNKLIEFEIIEKIMWEKNVSSRLSFWIS